MIKLREEAFPAAVAALLLWGLSSFLPKMAMQTMSPHSVIFYEAIGNMLVVIPVLFFLKGKLVRNVRGIKLTAYASCFSIIAILSYFTALRLGTVATIVTITAMYPVIVLVLAWVLLGERMNRLQMLAAVMALAAIGLLAG